MQRRKVDLPIDGNENGSGLHNSASKLSGRRMPRRGRGSMTSGTFVIVVSLVACLIVGTAMYFFPSQVQDVEMTTAKKTKDLVNNAYNLEQEMEKQVGEFLHHKPVIKSDGKRQQKVSFTAEDASKAMAKQPSSWVDGEKKLKRKLQVLFERQKQGKDLGVPVLTRYLGEDFPAWPGEGGMDEKEWRAQVDAKYKEMAEEEMKWRQEMKKMDERNKQR